MPRLYRVLVPAKDIETASRFYTTVLGIEGKRVSPGRHYFDCGGTLLACFDPSADGDGRKAQPNPEPIYLAVENLETTFRRCEEVGAVFAKGSPPGVGPLGEIAQRPWGERSFYVDDPTGNPLCFVDESTIFTG